MNRFTSEVPASLMEGYTYMLPATEEGEDLWVELEVGRRSTSCRERIPSVPRSQGAARPAEMASPPAIR